jgi:membrane protease YdiL (CAAX protease family)
MALTFALYTVLGAVSWDFTGNVFLGRLAEQFAMAGQSIDEGLPPGMTPKMMLIIFFVGGLTFFNIPGVITGFGEEFGHRGLMFPLLYQIKPWVAFLIGGLIWFAWHLPLMLIIPQTTENPLWLTVVNFAVTGVGSVCTFIYLAYVYVKSKSVFVTSIAHIAMNNASMSLSYFVILQNQVLANVGTSLAMVIVVAFLYFKNQFNVFGEYFEQETPPRVTQRPGRTVPA